MAARRPDDMRVGASDPPTNGATTQAKDTLHHRFTFGEAHASTRLPPGVSALDVNVCVVSLDADLVEAVRHSSGGHFAVSMVQSWADLVARIESGDCGIAVLDTAALGERVTKGVLELDRYSDRLVTLIAADREHAKDLVGLLSERKIHRLLIKPLAAGITRLLLESAVGRYLQLLGRPGADLVSTGKHFAPLPPLPPTPPRSSRGWVIGAAVLGAVAIGGAAWFFWSSSPPAVGAAANRGTAGATGPASPASSAPPVEPQPDRFAELMTSAERAFDAGQLTEPVGDNALDYYLTILAAEPTHSLAQSRLDLLVQALFTRTESALLDNSLDTADAILASVRRADPDSRRLAFLEAQLERQRGASPAAAARAAAAPAVALPAAVEVAAPAAPSPAAPSEIESLVAIAQVRIARRQLLEPQDDSAVHYLERASQLNAADPRVRAASAELVTGLVAAARTALRDDDVEAASRLLEPAQRLGGGQTVARLRAEVAAARNTSLLTRARERIRSGALFVPEEDSALNYLTMLDADFETTPEAAATWRDFSTQVGAQVQTALTARQWSAADSGIAALERTGRDPAAAASLRRRLVVERTQAQYLASAAPASELDLVSQTMPEYPPQLLERGTEGWVDLEFVVDKTGTPRDVIAVAGEPAGRFERAAVAAVIQYRYEPFRLDGQTYERRVRLRVRFNIR